MKKLPYFLMLFVLFNLFKAQDLQILNAADHTPLPPEIYFCGNETANLTIKASATVQTKDYKITSINNSLLPATVRVPFTLTKKNSFSQSLQLPFPFKFYDKTYDHVVVGSDGRLVFGDNLLLDELGQDPYLDDYPNNDGVQIINKSLNQIPSFQKIASIFGSWTRIQSGANATGQRNIFYQSDPTKFVVFFNNVPLEAGTDGVSFQMILYPDGTFDIIITQKPFVTNVPMVQNALVGIQNEDATLGQWPDNDGHGTDPDFYNNGKWKVDPSNPVGFHFEPQMIALTPKYSWFKVGQSTALSTVDSFILDTSQINDGDQLYAQIDRVDEDNNVIETQKSDTVLFKKMPQSLKIIPKYDNCGALTSVTADPESPYLYYNWIIDGKPDTATDGAYGIFGGGNIGDEIQLSAVSRFFRNQSCAITAAPVFSHRLILPNFKSVDETLCDTDQQDSKVIDLNTYFPVGSTYKLIYRNEEGNPITNLITIPSGTVFKGTVQAVPVSNSDCPGETFTFTFKYVSLPKPGQTYDGGSFCGSTSDFDLSDFENQFKGRGYNFEYSVDGGKTFQTLPDVDPSIGNMMVRFSADGISCSSTGTLHFNFYPPVIANNPTTKLEPQCASSTQSFDLTALIPEINPGTGVTISFYTSLSDAQKGNNPIADPAHFRANGIGRVPVWARVVDNQSGCVATNFPEIMTEVFRKPNILVQKPIQIALCAGDFNYNLTQDPQKLTDAPERIREVRYWSQDGKTQLTTSEVENYDPRQFGYQPFLQIIYNDTPNGTCDATIDFKLIQNPKPVAKQTAFTFCGERSYDLSTLKHQLIDNPENYIFLNADGTILSSDIALGASPTKLVIKIQDNTTGCISDQIELTFTRGTPTPLLKTNVNYPQVCDTEGDPFDGKTPVDLTAVQNALATNATFQYFADNNLTQPISDPTHYQTKGVSDLVYVKVSAKVLGFCPSLATIQLTIDLPTKVQGLKPVYNLCYGEPFAPNITNGNQYSRVEWYDPAGVLIGTGVDFVWSYQNISFGTYSVKLTNQKGCTYIEQFELSNALQPVIQKVNTDQNQIEVLVTGGEAPYQYSFDNGHSWQDSNILQNPSGSQYIIHVRNRDTGCSGAPLTVYFIAINNVITPNGDGKNDVWTIKNLDKMTHVEVTIADRYGNTVFHTTNAAKTTWNGTINGSPLPTASYWYVVKWLDPATQHSEVRTGWILLKNR